MEADGDQPAGDSLGGGGERLLALALAEVELRGRGDGHLDDAVGELPRNHFVEPDAVEAGMLGADVLEDLLPARGVEIRLRGARRITSRGEGVWVVVMAI